MITICIVEDTELIRERLLLHVSKMPMVKVLRAFSNGEDALEGLMESKPDLTIMDIGLPGMSGTELLARLINSGFSGDVVMFTVFDHDEHLFGALQLGAVGYILKEEGSSGVVAAIEEWRRGGSPMSRSIAQRVLQSFSQTRPKGLSAKLAVLTDQQAKILNLLAEGLQNKEIADRLQLTEGSIKQHNNRIYKKLSVNNRGEAIRMYLQNN